MFSSFSSDTQTLPFTINPRRNETSSATPSGFFPYSFPGFNPSAVHSPYVTQGIELDDSVLHPCYRPPHSFDGVRVFFGCRPITPLTPKEYLFQGASHAFR